MLLGCVSVAVGDLENVIYQHNPYYNNPQNPGYPFYRIQQGPRHIEVYGGIPGEVFQFEAVVEDNGQYVGPGDINRVLASTGAGPVVVTFVGHNGHPHGAANIKELRIDQPSVTGVIQALDISNDLGEYGPIRAGGVGTMTIGGNVLNDVGIWTDITGSLTVGGDVLYDVFAGGTIAGPVTIGRDLCTDIYRVGLMCASLGSLTVGGVCLA
jgi:hypothetical protein